MSKNRNEPLKIVITGAESCGKTTLAHDLALHFGVPYLKEYAREYLEKTNGNYNINDLSHIASGQIENENELLTQLIHYENQILVCDTDLLTLKIWSEEKFGHCAPAILAQIAQRHYDFYLLASPEGIAWEYDPQRENPHDRPRLTNIYEQNLQYYCKNYAILRGGRDARLQLATQHINLFLSNRNK